MRALIGQTLLPQAKVDDVELDLEEDLGSGAQFGRIAFANSAFDFDA